MKIRYLLATGLLALALGGCATTGDMADNSEAPTHQKVVSTRPSRAEIQARVVQELEQLGEKELAQSEMQALGPDGKPTYDIPITINKDVEFFIDYFQTKIPKRFNMWLGRSTRYEPMMRAILREYGLPEDLVYVALIESGFSCQAYSKAAAVGPWQFIKASATRFGLKVDYYVDERQDPIKSTHAAAKYLRELYNEFGSWYLAAAAYNAGENKIRRALSRYQASDYWTISHRQRDYLATETKEYVPKMIAAALIAKEPAKYGFTEVPYEPPLAFDEVRVDPGVSLSVAAKAAGLSTSDLAALNTELKHGATPPAGGMYTLRVPKGSAASFTQAYAQLTPAERTHHFAPAMVVTQKGDTLAELAKAHNLTLRQVAALNPRLSTKNRLKAGQRVYLSPSRAVHEPVRLAGASHAAPSHAGAQAGTRRITHTVQKGDTIWHIAQTYNLDYRDISRWNGSKAGKLGAGQKLVLYVPQAKAEARVETKTASRGAMAEQRELTYKVQKGDNLWEISRRFKVSPASLKRWNNLSDGTLNVGDRLVVRRDSNS